MTSIDVEPVDDIAADDITADHEGGAPLPERVEAPEYVLYGGKGGVGKTTMAAATAVASAATGTDTLVVSTDPAHSLSDTLGVDVPPEPTALSEGLYAAEIDPEAAMEEGVFGEGEEGSPFGGMGQLGEMLGGQGGEDGENPLGPMLGGSMPGADEAAAMRQLLEYLDDPRFDRVVVDTAPTGHTLRLLQLPETLDSMVGSMLKLRERFGGMMDSLGGMFGDDDPGEEPPGLAELQARIERLRAVLRDPAQTDFRVVMIPEEMSVVESRRLVERLDEFEIPVHTLVVNRVMEDLADVADVDEEWVVTPNHADCEFCERRWVVQQDALQAATDLFRGRDVRRVPLLAHEVRGGEALRVVAACLNP